MHFVSVPSPVILLPVNQCCVLILGRRSGKPVKSLTCPGGGGGGVTSDPPGPPRSGPICGTPGTPLPGPCHSPDSGLSGGATLHFQTELQYRPSGDILGDVILVDEDVRLHLLQPRSLCCIFQKWLDPPSRNFPLRCIFSIHRATIWWNPSRVLPILIYITHVSSPIRRIACTTTL